MVTPVAWICYEQLQVVAAELPENLSCVAVQGLCRPTHYTGLLSQVEGVGLQGKKAPEGTVTYAKAA